MSIKLTNSIRRINPNNVVLKKKLLRRGKLNIVGFLNDLPKSEHDLNSFTLDITFAQEKLMSFTT